MSVELLRRAWNTLDTFKQSYPENWHEEDQQVMDDLIKTDLDLSGVERKWQGLTDEDKQEIFEACYDEDLDFFSNSSALALAEAKLKEKNT